MLPNGEVKHARKSDDLKAKSEDVKVKSEDVEGEVGKIKGNRRTRSGTPVRSWTASLKWTLSEYFAEL